MTRDEFTEEISVERTDLKDQSLRMKIQIYVIAAISNAASFIAHTFTGLFAVFIESTTTALSFITSLRNLIQQAFQSVFGRISDKIGRKIMIFFGLLVLGASIALFPLIKNGWILVGGVIVFSIGFAILNPAFTALQGDITNRKNRAGFIGIISIIASAATTVALLVVGFLGNLGSNESKEFLIIFEIVAGLFIITAIISLFAKDPKTERLQKVDAFTLKPLKENPTFRKFLIMNSVMSFFMSLGWPIFPIIRGTYATNIENSWMWGIFCICQVIILIIIKPLINRIGRKWLLFLGRFLMFYVPINMIVTIYWLPNWWHMSIASAISGLCNALYYVGQNSYILDCAPLKEKGTYTGIHNLFIGISTFLGSLIMGIIADNINIRNDENFTLFIILLIIAIGRIIGTIGYLFISEPKSIKKEIEKHEENESLSLGN